MLAAGVIGCVVQPQPPPGGQRPVPEDRDLTWVCARHDLVTDLRGQMTFEDVQRTLCYLGRYGGHLDFGALEGAAIAAAQRCDAGRASPSLSPIRSARTIRDLYEILKVAAEGAGEASECTNRAMLQGMVASLGDEYRFRPIGDPPSTALDGAPEPSLLNQTIVYVKFPGLLNGGRQIVEQALRTARDGHAVRGLMLDLRGSDGAPMEELAQFLDLFFDDGVVLAWQHRKPSQLEQRNATRLPPAETAPLIVIVDDKTHSGAEAFAAVLRARGRALLVGRRTSGNALVQTVVDLPSGSHLLMPVGDLLEPGVGVISGRGVTPDVDLGPVLAAPNPGGEDQAILFGAQVFLATRSNDRAELLQAARQILSARCRVTTPTAPCPR